LLPQRCVSLLKTNRFSYNSHNGKNYIQGRDSAGSQTRTAVNWADPGQGEGPERFLEGEY
jgi:hypothetical protein